MSYGLHPEATGEIKISNRTIRPETIRERIDLGLMLVPEDRQRLGLVQKLSVAQNISLASLKHFVSGFWLDETRKRAIVKMMRDLAVKARSPESDHLLEQRQPTKGRFCQEPADPTRGLAPG